MKKLMKADVEFNVNGKPIKFSIVHNLAEVKGMSFNDAFDCWVHRTKSYKAKSLCKYIMSKDESFVAMTYESYLNLQSTKVN